MEGYKWLEVVVLILLAGCCFVLSKYKKYKTRTLQLEKCLKRDEYLLNEYCEWIKRISEGSHLELTLKDRGIEKVAIYGMGRLGLNIIDYLRNVGINVLYGIDSNPANCFSEIDVFGLDDNLPEVDAIIVTPAYAIDSITEKLERIVSYPVISVDELIFNSKIER